MWCDKETLSLAVLMALQLLWSCSNCACTSASVLTNTPVQDNDNDADTEIPNVDDEFTRLFPSGSDNDYLISALGISNKLPSSNGATSLDEVVTELSRLHDALRTVNLRLDTAAVRSDLDSLREQLAGVLPAAPTAGSSEKAGAEAATYVRWGSGSCPESAELVYSGLMAGSHYSTSGGAANDLCLPTTPTFTNAIAEPVYGVAKLYGVEYESRPHASNDMDGLCAVCRTRKATTLMVPATDVCPAGWTREYRGYLMAGKPDRARVSTEYICVDGALESREGSGADNNNGVVYFTKYTCGSLPCPPFRAGEIVTCAVCAK